MKNLFTVILVLSSLLPTWAQGDGAIVVSVNAQTGVLTRLQAGTTSTWNGVWTYSSAPPRLTLTSSANNMSVQGGKFIIAAGTARSAVYTLATSADYVIDSYSFRFASQRAGTTVDITPEKGQAVRSVGTEMQRVEGTSGHSCLTYFLLADAANSMIEVSEFEVVLRPAPERPEHFTRLLFETTPSMEYPYRIPALVQARNGNLIALTDYRICKKDIGYGRVDLHVRLSKDGGTTWGAERVVVEGTGVSGAWDCGFGDGVLVADAESDSVLLMCVCGNVPFGSGTRDNTGHIARLLSTDCGETWSPPADVTEDILSLFDHCSQPPLRGAFIGSGKMWQSKTVKVGKHRRIYAPLEATPGGNRVLFSDDLGATWRVLGSADDTPIPKGNEPKCVELPDGNVLMTSRTLQGRWFNIFTYTDVERGEGRWAVPCLSSAATHGILVNGTNCGCNGANQLVPARRTADGAPVYVLLQSIPFGPDRAGVGIYYKEMASCESLSTPDSIAWNWDGRFLCSQLSSAYSEMFLQQDGSLGFLYEENDTGNTFRYNIVYKRFTLSEITSGAYAYDPDFDEAAWLHTGMAMPQVTPQNCAAYDLQGRRGLWPGSRGVFISEGKKLIR